MRRATHPHPHPRTKWPPGVRAIIAVLCCALIISTLFIEVPSENTYAAVPSGGANDTAQTNYMNQASPTSGNKPYNTPDNTPAVPEVVPGPWIDYLNTLWHTTCQPNFQWADTSTVSSMSGPWGGQAASTANTGNSQSNPQTRPLMIPYHNTSTNVWEIWSGEQLQYVISNSSVALTAGTIRLMQNIDLNGNQYAWTYTTSKIITSMTIDGNNFGIYNLGTLGSNPCGVFVYALQAVTVQNLSFYNAKLVGSDGGHGVSIFGYLNPSQGSTPTKITNVHVKNSLVFNGDRAANNGTSFLFSISDGTPTVLNQITNCSVEKSFSYGNNHVSTLGSYAAHNLITNSYTTDSIVVSTGYHSGGFVSCYEGFAQFQNCFTNNTMYGAYKTGVFVGEASDATFTNCYTSGMVEGYDRLGGFVGYTKTGLGSADTNPTSTYANQAVFVNCYSTSMVGMENGGTRLGGFIGSMTDLSSSSRGAAFQNCYAAGEVGDIDTVVTNPRTSNTTVGGFLGVNESAAGSSISYTNCYYDKQTTAMREWTSGAAQVVAGITGLLTTDTNKSGFGLTHSTAPATTATGFKGFASGKGSNGNSDWVFANALYPQLAVFANATTTTWLNQTAVSAVQACSEASASTVFCDTYEKNYDNTAVLPVTTYDTVRDLTQNVPMTTLSALVWQKIGVDGEPANPTVLLYGQTMSVVTLTNGAGGYVATKLAPGIQWLNVQATVGGQVGQRTLRLVPTANLQAGADQTLTAGSFYNHAEDVRMAYSTAPRLAASATDITQGVFPDKPLDASQQAVQDPLPAAYQTAFDAVDNWFVDVDVNHMELDQGHTEGIASNASTGVMYVTGVNSAQADIGLDNTNSAIDNKFNAVTAFLNADANVYTLTYNWVLQDGRFLQDSKVITIDTIYYLITEKYYDLAGDQVDPAGHPDVGYTIGGGETFYALNTQGSEPSAQIGDYSYIGYRLGSASSPLISTDPPSPLITPVLEDQTIIYVYEQVSMPFVFYKQAISTNPLADVVFSLTPQDASGTGWDSASMITTQSAHADGQVRFDDLASGTYLLQETATLPGFALPEGDWIVTVDVASHEVTIAAQGSPMAFAHDNNGNLVLFNYQNWDAPMTGRGFGILLFMVLGAVLLGLALFLALSSRKNGAAAAP